MKDDKQNVLINEQDEKSTAKKENLDRRSFLRGGAAGALLGLGAVAAKKNELAAKVAKKVEESGVTTHDELPFEINDKYAPFDQKNTVFNRGFWDKKIAPKAMKFGQEPVKNESGYTQLDKAMRNAGWSVEYNFGEWSMNGQPDTQAYKWEGYVAPTKVNFKNDRDAAEKVKRAAEFLGADLVGIAKYNPQWTYSTLLTIDKLDTSKNAKYPRMPKGIKPRKPDFPFTPKSVIVMAVEMDYEATAASPTYISGAAVGQGYSKMAEVGYSLATFIRELGYKAFASGNDTALSIPYAIMAGLGECGRNGLLVTQKYGPRVRLVKVFTELDIAADKPVTFGVVDFCRKCKRCAEACPSKAIPMEEEPTFEGKTISNMNGVKKWYIDPEKCFNFWVENTVCCSNCIASCPYNKPEMWNHTMINSLTRIPSGPLHYFMARLDKVFGYGNTFDRKANARWWNRKNL